MAAAKPCFGHAQHARRISDEPDFLFTLQESYQIKIHPKVAIRKVAKKEREKEETSHPPFCRDKTYVFDSIEEAAKNPPSNTTPPYTTPQIFSKRKFDHH